MGKRWEEYKPEGNDFVPIAEWGQDHWSTLLYFETCTVDKGGVVSNLKMRCNPRLHRTLIGLLFGAEVNDGSKYPTRLRDGELQNHDDWSCLEDMARAGLLRAWFRGKNDQAFFGGAEAKVQLTDYGRYVASRLRGYRADGNPISKFAL